MLAEITNGLSRKGHNVTIIMPSGGVIEYPVLSRVIVTSNSTLKATDYPAADIIVSNYYLTVPSAQMASALGRGRHIRLSLCYEPAFLPDNHLSLPTYHATDKLLVLSTWQQQLVQLVHGIRTEIVPVGIDKGFGNLNIRAFRKHPAIAAIVREPEGFASHRDQHYLMEQLEGIRQKYPQIEIHLITPPSELAASPALREIQASGRFRFFTPKNDEELNHCYNHADIFVTSSYFETANLPGLESMRCGCALVATYAGGNSDYAKHGQNCLMSYRYQNLLFSHIEALLEDPQLRKRLALEGEREAAKWTWERSVERFERAVLSF